jgi:hypothetical protein
MTPRDRRALMIGAATLATAWLALRAIPWAVRDLHARRERLVGREELLVRTRAEIRDVQALGDSAAALQHQVVALAGSLMSGRLESDALADLAKRVSVVAADQRVRVLRTVAVPDSSRAGRLRRATVQTSLEGDARGLLGALARLERASAGLTVADVRLTAVDPASASAGPEIIAGEIVVWGWYLAPAPSGVGGQL